MSDPHAILAFWFGEPAASPAALQAKFQRWYVASPDLDREIAERFTADVERALAGELAAWRTDLHASLALVVVLDQLARTIFRGHRRAFAGDAVACEIASALIEHGRHREVTLEERVFLLMPLLHAEDRALQDRVAQLSQELVADAPPALQPVYRMVPEQSAKYGDIIAQFGRFPHRNEALGRVSTEAERAFLRDWQARQHPTGMHDRK